MFSLIHTRTRLLYLTPWYLHYSLLNSIPSLWDLNTLRGCLVSVSKQQFSVFKQHFTYFHTLFHPHVFSQKFLNNNFQFLNTCTKRALTDALSFHDFIFLFIFLLSHATYHSFPLKSILSSLFSSLSLWWVSKFVKHDCVSHTIPLVLILLFFYKLSYEAKDYSVFEERNDGIDFAELTNTKL